jgi:4-hydroxybutyryl-CoA dehydratase/vinylacetyl-CoA-Delta-isomerase
MTYNYATHHRHSCIGARAGFGDLLIGAGALMCEANGFDPGEEHHLRDQMVELIKITEGFLCLRCCCICLCNTRCSCSELRA